MTSDTYRTVMIKRNRMDFILALLLKIPYVY